MPLVLSGTNGISTNGTNIALSFDSSGRVRQPNQVYVYARCSTQSAFSLTSSGNHIVQYNSAPVNIGSAWNTSTYRFTAPVAGRYLVYAHGQINASNTTSWGINTGVWKNGSVQDGVYETTPGLSYYKFHITSIITCAVSDFIDIRLLMNVASGSIEYTSADQRFACHIHLLS